MQGDTSEQMRLGAFPVLPNKIRALSWRELASSFHNNPPPWLSVLLANKSLKDDIYELHRAVDLVLTVDGLCPLISLEGSYGNMSFARSSPDQRHPLFGMPFHALRGISFHIRPPDSRDPGQLINMITTVSEILDMLAHSHKLPPLSIHFVEPPSRTWSNEQQGGECSIPEEGISDFRWLFDLFSRVRGAASCLLDLPPRLIELDPALNRDRLQVEADATAKTPFNDKLSLDGSQDYNIRLREIVRMFKADNNLDYLPGPTAAFLRRQRFKYWDQYEDRLSSLPFQDPHNFALPIWATARGKQMDLNWIIDDQNNRYLDMRTWSPYDYVDRQFWLGLGRPDENGDEKCEPFKITFRNNKHKGVSARGEDLWETYYPNGIPAKESDEWWRNREDHEDYYAYDVWCHWTEDQLTEAKMPNELWDYIDFKMRRIRSHMMLSHLDGERWWGARAAISCEDYPDDFGDQEDF